MFKKRGIIIYSGINLIYKPKFTYMYTYTKITEHFNNINVKYYIPKLCINVKIT